MTQEEKAKAYDEAIEKLRGMIPNWERLSYNGKTFLQDLIYIFPELKESEDERIRENIIATIHLYYGEPLEDEAKEMIAWLEKQGKNNMGISEATKQELEDSLHKALEKETPESCNEFLDEQILANSAKTCKDEQKPVSEDLEDAAKRYALNNTPYEDCTDEMSDAFKAGAQWQKKHLWKSAEGSDLPIFDREVIAILYNGKVVFAHRPPEYWDGKDIVTGKVTRNYPKTYGKGGWNIPDVKFWLDVELPKEIEI